MTRSPIRHASRGDRFLAQLIDAAIAAGPAILIAAILRSGTLAFGFSLMSLLWAAFYLFLADGFPNGQSFGKRVVEVKVIDERSGEPCDFGQSFIRNVILAALGPIDWIFIFGDRHQRLGDRAAGTVVVPAA